MYSTGMPKIEELVSLGNEFYGFNILDISTTDSTNHTTEQREVRLRLYPVSLEYSHHYKDDIVFGIRVFRFAIQLRFEYGKSTRR